MADDAGEAHIGSSLEEMTNPDGLDLPSIERFGSAEKLDGAKIGAGSIVTKDIPDNVIAYGNPCKVVRENK